MNCEKKQRISRPVLPPVAAVVAAQHRRRLCPEFHARCIMQSISVVTRGTTRVTMLWCLQTRNTRLTSRNLPTKLPAQGPWYSNNLQKGRARGSCSVAGLELLRSTKLSSIPRAPLNAWSDPQPQPQIPELLHPKPLQTAVRAANSKTWRQLPSRPGASMADPLLQGGVHESLGFSLERWRLRGWFLVL